MAWTNPETAVAGEVLTAAYLNTNVRDNLLNLRALANVQSVSKTDTFSTSSTSYTDVTGLSVSITPTANTSKVLVMGNVYCGPVPATSNFYGRLMRNSTAISVGAAAGSRDQVTFMFHDSGNQGVASFVHLDSPATISAVTYKVQVRCLASTIHVNRAATDTDAAGFARAASNIVVMEIPA